MLSGISTNEISPIKDSLWLQLSPRVTLSNLTLPLDYNTVTNTNTHTQMHLAPGSTHRSPLNCHCKVQTFLTGRCQLKFSDSYSQAGRQGKRYTDRPKNSRTNKQIHSRSTSLTVTPNRHVHTQFSWACGNIFRGRTAHEAVIISPAESNLSERSHWTTFSTNVTVY